MGLNPFKKTLVQRSLAAVAKFHETINDLQEINTELGDEQLELKKEIKEREDAVVISAKQKSINDKVINNLRKIVEVDE